VRAYNDMLSAHPPLERFPAIITDAANEVGATALVAGGVPAMCDGVTQGRPGMELSLFSRDVIAMATAVAMSHDAFDGGLYLGVCDKIVPGLVIGALAFGHLPAIFVPGGPMTSGLPNSEKAKIRALYAEGKVGRDKLLEAEQAAYHGPGTCTFYGTANSNQMLMEMMGLHLRGSAFVHPNTPLRDALVKAAAKRCAAIGPKSDEWTPAGRVIDEKAIVNGLVGLMATGGSTNHALHMVAMAAAAGIALELEDFDDISRATPLLARVYPNGTSDVNHFQAAGGMAFVTRELLGAGLAHEDVLTVAGRGLTHYTTEPFLDGDALVWRDGAKESLDRDILRPVSDPFQPEGGLRLLKGNVGRGVIKVSAVDPSRLDITAPAAVFDSQDAFLAAFQRGELYRDVVAVVRFQGPRANGMPELHSLTPALSVIQDRGYKTALVTDGRMSGASGKVPAAIHLTPEAAAGGPLAYIQNGDLIHLDARTGRLEALVDEATLRARTPAAAPPEQPGFGRELFANFRRVVGAADHGASVIFG
ncbi:MAG: phosphogluconate dehydratase, partial [Ignavibacteriales bacterium]